MKGSHSTVSRVITTSREAEEEGRTLGQENKLPSFTGVKVVHLGRSTCRAISSGGERWSVGDHKFLGRGQWSREGFFASERRDLNVLKQETTYYV